MPEIEVGWAAIQIPMELIESDVGWEYVLEHLRYYCSGNACFRLPGPPSLVIDHHRFNQDMYLLIFPVGREKWKLTSIGSFWSLPESD